MIGKKINQLATELAPVSTDLTIIGDPTTGVSKKITLAQLGAIFSGAVSFYTNLAGFPATGDINVIYCAKDTQKLYLWSGSAYVEVFPSQALLDTYQLRSEKGVSNGYASLDSSGKVPISQLPSSIMEYKGTWNAATNTPTLANGTGDTGDVYICNVAGTVNFGAGAITFAVGDYVIYSGSIWQRSSGAVGTVTSVSVSRSGDALAITGSPITTSGTINIGFAGTGAQYIKGDGTLATFPSTIAQAERLITEVYNSTGATLTKGTIVYINGGQGNLPTVTKALATGDSTSAQTFGVVQADITNNNNGYVVVAGKLSDLDTQAYTEGTQLYLSATTAGAWTSTKQYAPNHLVYVGIVVRAHPTQGIVEIKIQNGYELDELHDVAAQNPDNNDILQYKTSTSLWTKVAGTTSNIAEGSNLYYTDARSRAALSFTAGSGAYNSTTGVITIPTNTNQLTNGAAFITLASLSAGAGISYNNTTGVIASTITQYTDAMARASISLTTTGTSGAATYNSTTGVLNIPNYAPDLSGYVPTSRTLTINGTAYDLSANRSWSVGTVTSVGLSSATSGVTIGSTPVTTSGTITLAIATASGSQQGLLSSTDWTTFNNKQNALTNPVTGTGTTNTLVKFTGSSTIGNSIVSESGSALSVAGSVDATIANLSLGLKVTGSNLSSGTGAEIVYSSGKGIFLTFNRGAGTYLPTEIDGSTVTLSTSGTPRLNLNASGNLGLGVTPSAWSTSFYNAIEGGDSNSQGAIAFNLNGTSNGVDLWANGFFDGTNSVYKYNGTAGLYQVAGNVHRWYNAPSGTAGNAISFTQAMTLNASGNLSIGNTNDTYKLDVSGTGMFRTTSTNPAIRVLLPGNSNATLLSSVDPSGYGWQFQQEEVSTGDFRIFRTLENTSYQVLNIARSTGAATFSSRINGVVGGTAYNTAGLWLQGSSSTDGIAIGGTGGGDKTIDTYGGTLKINGTAGNGLSVTGAATFSNDIQGGGDLYFNKATRTTIYPTTTNQNLHIKSNGSGVLQLNNDNTGNLTMCVGGGLVGIGTPSPASILNLKSSTTTELRLESVAGTYRSFIGFRTDGQKWDVGVNLNDTNDALSFNSVGTERMRITSGGLVGIGTSSPKSYASLTTNGMIVAMGSVGVSIGESLRINNYYNAGTVTDRTISTGFASSIGLDNTSGGMTFNISSSSVTADNNVTVTERMRITSGGNVGIGVTSVNGLLSLKANKSNTPILRFQNQDGGPDSAISTYTTSAQTYTLIGHNIYVDSSGNAPRFNTSYPSCGIAFDEGDLRFLTGNSSANASSKLTIASTGAATFSSSVTTGDVLQLGAGGAGGGVWTWGGSDAYIYSPNSKNLWLSSGNTGTNGLKIATTGAATFSSTIQTAAPTNGTAQPWRLGNAVSGSISTDSYIIVSVNGTTYSIPALNGLP